VWFGAVAALEDAELLLTVPAGEAAEDTFAVSAGEATEDMFAMAAAAYAEDAEPAAAEDAEPFFFFFAGGGGPLWKSSPLLSPLSLFVCVCFSMKLKKRLLLWSDVSM